MKAFVFPGQGAQFSGMGKELYNNFPKAKEMFEQANEILGFKITDIMFEGSAEELKQTKVTQPAIFLHSVILSQCIDDFAPDMVAGHSLGEFSALVAVKAMSFEEGLKLVYARSIAMQKACEIKPSTMAAVLGMEDSLVQEICNKVEGVVIPANYNCKGQLVISGETQAVQKACELLKASGARRAMILPVGGAFHSPLMDPAKEELKKAIIEATVVTPICPVYQNVDAMPHTNPEEIKENLIKQLTAPVLWRQIIEKMDRDGASEYIELGPGKVLQGLIKKILPNSTVSGKE